MSSELIKKTFNFTGWWSFRGKLPFSHTNDHYFMRSNVALCGYHPKGETAILDTNAKHSKVGRCVECTEKLESLRKSLHG